MSKITQDRLLLFWQCLAVSFLTLASLAKTGQAQAQITSDGTLGTQVNRSTSLPCNGGICTITGGTTDITGRNLFHSFQNFSIPTGGEAHFDNSGSIQNIINRVTGISNSNIDGTISANGTANVFLINPNGIIFGANAHLNIGGSFVGTTANAMQFGNTGSFGATTGNNVALLTVKPSAFLFNQIANQSITNKATLQVQNGQSLLLVAKNVTLDGGKLLAPGGRVELGGLAQPGIIRLYVADNNLETYNNTPLLIFPKDVALGDVYLTNGAEVNVRAGRSGSIVVNAANLNMSARSKLWAGIGSDVGSSDSQAGDIDINATEVITLDNGSFIANTVKDKNNQQRENNQAVHNAGNINIRTETLKLTNGSVIDAGTYGIGNAGNVNINVPNTVYMDGVDLNSEPSGIYSRVWLQGVGQGGNIDIKTGSLFMTNGTAISTSIFGKGNAGSVTINALDTVSLDGVKNSRFSAIASRVAATAIGNGGNIKINTATLSVTNGAEVLATTRGTGNAGNIEVNAAKFVNLSGVAPQGFSSGLFSAAENSNSGQASDIIVNTSALRIADGAVLSARTLSSFSGGNIIVDANTVDIISGGQILTTSFSSGSAGKININANNRITISGSDSTFDARLAEFGRPTVDPVSSVSGIFANTERESRGNGGSIFMHPPQLIIKNGAGVAVNSQGTGNGGNIQIQAGLITLDNNAFISAATASGEGGNIEMQAGRTLSDNSLLLMRHNSYISATASGTGNGGNITINAPFIVTFPQEDNNIITRAIQGRGGNIHITTQGLFGFQSSDQLTPKSDISASSDFGINGTVEINTPDTDPSQGLAQLPTEVRVPEIAQGCTVGGGQVTNSFIVTGTGGLPPNPGEVLSSNQVLDDLGSPATEKTASSSTEATPLISANAMITDTNGQISLVALLPAGCHGQ
ncbi:filamentous hemagglutinin N-terminal domain-containing protein [Anabaena azotica]|uniref:two-partner secretion domain-containing protein n=1 Tax=Anabaena azotica TaxID=197653 RepID=UPI0039A4ABD3